MCVSSDLVHHRCNANGLLNSRAPSNLDGALDSELRNKKAQKGLFVHICSDSAVTICSRAR